MPLSQDDRDRIEAEERYRAEIRGRIDAEARNPRTDHEELSGEPVSTTAPRKTGVPSQLLPAVRSLALCVGLPLLLVALLGAVVAMFGPWKFSWTAVASVSPLYWLPWIATLLLAAWVYIDARVRGIVKTGRNLGQHGPAGWGWFMLILWPIALPWYLIKTHGRARGIALAVGVACLLLGGPYVFTRWIVPLSGVVEFGTDLNPKTWQIIGAKPVFQPDERMTWVARFNKPLATTAIEVLVVAVRDQSQTVLSREMMDIADPSFTILHGRHITSLLVSLDNVLQGGSTYILRFVKDNTVIAEGTFRIGAPTPSPVGSRADPEIPAPSGTSEAQSTVPRRGRRVSETPWSHSDLG